MQHLRRSQTPMSMLAIHEQCKQENDRKRNSDQPEQRTFTETHVSLLVV
ncbi:MAG: hypothetical protein Q7U97_16785 [Rhodocyclaceae bacterium]|nr:hypothetical protein [Rhodocyclaceae bacterium]